MRVRTGTSGFSYKEWEGVFYPEDLPRDGMLGHYASRLETVEINNTFYRMPSEKLLLGWAGQVPDDFSFVLKASQRITHEKRLKDAGDELSYLLRTANVLGKHLGPMLFQLPRFLRKDVARRKDFLDLFPRGRRAAFEFRHGSWFDDDVFETLRAYGMAHVAADNDDAEEPKVVPTAGYGYVRLRRSTYDESTLDRWAERIASQPWSEASVFFKDENKGAGPDLAIRFARRTEGDG